MPSPFPGMDPYLEDARLWPGFHRSFVTNLISHLEPGLSYRYQTRKVGLTLPSEPPLECIEIAQRADGRLVTFVFILSPNIKGTDEARTAYLDKWKELKAAGVNPVEIDLLLRGKPPLEYSRDGLPKWNYAVTVMRATQPERYEIYTATLNKRLPRFRLPLAADDRDTVLDLQTAFTKTYDEGGFASKVSYQDFPAVPLDEEDRRRIAELLKLKYFSHEQIAEAAYFLWLQEGCAHGHDVEHWKRAIEQLKREKG